MTRKYMLFRGCLIPVRYPQFEATAQKIFPSLGIELEKNNGNFTCCPEPIQIGSAHRLNWLTMATRNLCVAEEKNCNIISLCNGCTNTLVRAHHQVTSNEETKKQVNSILKEVGREYKGNVEIKHFIQVINETLGVDGLKKVVKKPLKGLKVAAHPGCHLLRPEELMNFDNPLDPIIIDELIEALGATAIDYDNKSDCCGFSLSLAGDMDGSVHAVGSKIKQMTAFGADALVTGCPSCYQQFTLMQKKASKQFGFEPISVYFFTDLLGVAMGYNLETMQLTKDKLLNNLM